MNTQTIEQNKANGAKGWIINSGKVKGFLLKCRSTDFGATKKEIIQATGLSEHFVPKLLQWMIKRNIVERGEQNYDMYFLSDPKETVLTCTNEERRPIVQNVSDLAGTNVELIKAATNMMNASAQLMGALAKVI